MLEMVAAMEKASGKSIPTKIGDRRPGDIAICYAATDKAERELGWKANRDLDSMCKDLDLAICQPPRLQGLKEPELGVIDGRVCPQVVNALLSIVVSYKHTSLLYVVPGRGGIFGKSGPGL